MHEEEELMPLVKPVETLEASLGRGLNFLVTDSADFQRQVAATLAVQRGGPLFWVELRGVVGNAFFKRAGLFPESFMVCAGLDSPGLVRDYVEVFMEETSSHVGRTVVIDGWFDRGTEDLESSEPRSEQLRAIRGINRLLLEEGVVGLVGVCSSVNTNGQSFLTAAEFEEFYV